MRKILVLGGITFDTIIHLDKFPEPKPATIHSNRSHETIGSTGAAKALCFEKLGMDVTFHGIIGNDIYGEKIKNKLSNSRINFLYDIDPLGTERHVNLMNDEGGRISIYTNPGTFDPKVDYNEMESYIEHSDYVVLNIINYCRNYIPLIKKHNQEIWCDLHDYDGVNSYHQDFLEAADYIFMSSDCLEDYKTTMQDIIAKGKKLVVCTHGKNGVSALADDGAWYHLPIANSYERKDTNGAGDNFFSGFLFAHSLGYSILQCLKFGTITAGLCITSEELVYEGLNEEVLYQEYIKHYSEKL
ncbi:MAG: carbohydrate kinase family protein [Bacillota bacterium]|nr:carbohydrate kinase family protein [Bacillota bacterium]